MSYQEYRPHPSLADYIKCLWVVERDFQPLNGIIDILPDSYVEVIFNFGSTCQVNTGSFLWELPACYVVTMFDKPFRLHTTGVLKTIGIRFFPWGFKPLMKLDLNLAVPIYILDDSWQSLSKRLQYVSNEEAFIVLQQHFMQTVITVQLHQVEALLTSQLLFNQRGEIKIDDLAQRCYLSRRQLERKFREIVGISPKMLARQIRFEHVRDHLCREPNNKLSVLAEEYGYADQAHLSRDFKGYSGRTLRQFTTEIAPVQEDLRFGVAFPDA